MPWRLIRHGAAPGAVNMAVDEAIGRAVAEIFVPPTLVSMPGSRHVSRWGATESLAAVDVARCALLGYDIVRRPTGRSAILHTDELTYSVAARQADPLMSGLVLDVYLRLAGGLVEGLRRLGVEGRAGSGSEPAGSGCLGCLFRGAVGLRNHG